MDGASFGTCGKAELEQLLNSSLKELEKTCQAKIPEHSSSSISTNDGSSSSKQDITLSSSSQGSSTSSSSTTSTTTSSSSATQTQNYCRYKIGTTIIYVCISTPNNGVCRTDIDGLNSPTIVNSCTEQKFSSIDEYMEYNVKSYCSYSIANGVDVVRICLAAASESDCPTTFFGSSVTGFREKSVCDNAGFPTYDTPEQVEIFCAIGGTQNRCLPPVGGVPSNATNGMECTADSRNGALRTAAWCHENSHVIIR
jgi:hypothetical protein